MQKTGFSKSDTQKKSFSSGDSTYAIPLTPLLLRRSRSPSASPRLLLIGLSLCAIPRRRPIQGNRVSRSSNTARHRRRPPTGTVWRRSSGRGRRLHRVRGMATVQSGIIGGDDGGRRGGGPVMLAGGLGEVSQVAYLRFDLFHCSI